MANATRSPRKTASPSGTLLEELAREVFALRAELTSLREQLATEVRTRRLVVVDDTGFEAIVAETAGREHDSPVALIKVAPRTAPDTNARIYADAHSDGGTLSCGFHLVAGGEGVGMFEVHRRELEAEDPGGPFDYTTTVDVIDDRGPRFSLGFDGLQFIDR